MDPAAVSAVARTLRDVAAHRPAGAVPGGGSFAAAAAALSAADDLLARAGAEVTTIASSLEGVASGARSADRWSGGGGVVAR